MYERFTDRARKVMQLANQEAQRFNHEYIGTEHILLGLIREGEGVAAAILTNLNVDLEEIQQKIEGTVKKGKAAAAAGISLPNSRSASARACSRFTPASVSTWAPMPFSSRNKPSSRCSVPT